MLTFCCKLYLVDPVGIEPTTSALQMQRSTAELRARYRPNILPKVASSKEFQRPAMTVKPSKITKIPKNFKNNLVPPSVPKYLSAQEIRPVIL